MERGRKEKGRKVNGRKGEVWEDKCGHKEIGWMKCGDGFLRGSGKGCKG